MNKIATSPQPANCRNRAVITQCLYFFNPLFQSALRLVYYKQSMHQNKKVFIFLGLEYAVCTKISVSVFKNHWAGLESYCCHALLSTNRWCQSVCGAIIHTWNLSHYVEGYRHRLFRYQEIQLDYKDHNHP